jgi:hypothetical protein
MAVSPNVTPAPRGCRDKVKYPSAAAAGDGLIRLTERINSGQLLPASYHWSAGPLAVYECSFCGYWHIGHTAPTRRP